MFLDAAHAAGNPHAVELWSYEDAKPLGWWAERRQHKREYKRAEASRRAKAFGRPEPTTSLEEIRAERRRAYSGVEPRFRGWPVGPVVRRWTEYDSKGDGSRIRRESQSTLFLCGDGVLRSCSDPDGPYPDAGEWPEERSSAQKLADLKDLADRCGIDLDADSH